MGVAWGTEGAQECDVLLQFVQGRAVGKGPARGVTDVPPRPT